MCKPNCLTKCFENVDFYSLLRFMLYDCDPFTRDYYIEILNIVQPEPIQTINLKKDNLTVARLVTISFLYGQSTI